MTETVSQFGLHQQGYDHSPDALAELNWGLRFTPALCMVGAAVGLATQQAWIHFSLAILGIAPFWFPASNPLDVLYNRVLRPLWHGVALPPNPLPRRIACLMGGAMNIGIGVAFTLGSVSLAYALGAMLLVLQLVVITTHFCVASWMYEGLLRMLGRFTPPISSARAHELVEGGALLIDVREPDEFARDHLPGARNVPLDLFEQAKDELPSGPFVVYCRSGLRSQRALQIANRDDGYNLGAMTRWTPQES
ncbi:MAG: DUF4395 family protein [Myxococcota bacterium]|jgi:rhodanese-related sulfurtransferase|nr:DUF4395 family protein [Myxococcota bacterium]